MKTKMSLRFNVNVLTQLKKTCENQIDFLKSFVKFARLYQKLLWLFNTYDDIGAG